MSKNERSKIFQIYLRPWTEGTGVATRTVHHLKDLGKFIDDAAMCAEPGAAEIPATEKIHAQDMESLSDARASPRKAAANQFYARLHCGGEEPRRR